MKKPLFHFFLFCFSLTTWAVSGAFPAGIRGYWSFDRTLEESRGQKTSLSRENHRSGFVKGVKGDGLAFDGEGDFINLGTETLGIEETGEFSIALWVNPGGGEGTIFRKGRYLTPFSLEIEDQRGTLRFKAGIRGSRSAYLYSGTVPEKGEWIHLALTYREPFFVLYINGEEDNRLTMEGPPEVNSYDELLLGKGLDPKKPDFCQVIIDELQIYNMALAAGDVKELYSGTAVYQKKEITRPRVLYPGEGEMIDLFLGKEAYSHTKGTELFISGEERVTLSWNSGDETEKYLVLRSPYPGWKGTLRLLAEAQRGDTLLRVERTAGLIPGEELHFREKREDYYIKRIVDNTHIELTYPLESRLNPRSARVNLAGGWVKNYSSYTLRKVFSRGQERYSFNEEISEEMGDCFYVVACVKGNEVTGFSNVVNARMIGGKVFHDFASGSAGGYSWKVTQHYGDTPELIDGDPRTPSVRVQLSDPGIKGIEELDLGFHRFLFGEKMLLGYVEVYQDTGNDRIRVTRLKLGYETGDEEIVDLEKDSKIIRGTKQEGNRNYETFLIPINRKSSFVNLFNLEAKNKKGRYIAWSKVSFYSSGNPGVYPTSPVLVDKTAFTLDFSRASGTLPALFGTDEIYNNVEGIEYGWMLNTWSRTRKLFNLYRLNLSDFWPRAYGFDFIKVGELKLAVSPDSLSFELRNHSPHFYALGGGNRLRIGDELLSLRRRSGNQLILNERGMEFTLPRSYPQGTPVYVYKQAGQILRLQEIFPEFPVVKYADAYVSGISRVDSRLDVNHPSRQEVLEIVLNKGDFKPGDLMRNGREIFKVESVRIKGDQKILTALRGYDGTNQTMIQGNYPVKDVYKILDYEPYYEGFKNDPTDYSRFYWDNLKNSLDKLIIDGQGIPWAIAYAPIYATEHRGRIKEILSLSGNNNAILDEYNSVNDDGDFWYHVDSRNQENNLHVVRRNTYQFGRAELHILTGRAAGKVFYVRGHNKDTLTVVRTWQDGGGDNPLYVDLEKEGVRPGDIYKITHGSNRGVRGNPVPRFWQYNADLYYNIIRYITENYTVHLKGQPFFLEYFGEPNLTVYGTWTLDAYIRSFNVMARTLRTGGPHFKNGYSRKAFLIGAGAMAGGLNPDVKIPGSRGDYGLALSLIEEGEYLDFISHHRYYMGSRVQKRENSWEYKMLREYAAKLKKDIFIVDSEDSVATAGGTGNEQARHWSRFSVPYWHSNFVNSYYGDFGELGRLALIIHFRLYYRDTTSLGMAVGDKEGRPLLDLVYWPLDLFLSHTSMNPHQPDTLAYASRCWDSFGWVQVMGTIHGETGKKYVHLVNKKDSPVTLNLELLGIKTGARFHLKSIIGSGPRQTLKDGYHPPGLGGAVRESQLLSTDAILLEPHSVHLLEIVD